MQTLWTRAAQLGGVCRCPQCTSPVHGISRRSAASATRRMPRYFTTSTLLYSGIFAVATTYDAKSKRERREQWDEAIAEIKHELGQPRKPEGPLTEQEASIAWEETRLSVYDSDSQIAEFGSVLDSTFLKRAKHWAPRSTTGAVDAHDAAPQSLYAATSRKRKYLSRPWSEKKLERVRLCMDKLQLDIMEELKQTGLSQDAAQHVPHFYGQHILLPSGTRRQQFAQKLGDIARLRTEQGDKLHNWKRSDKDVPLSAYQMDDGGHFVERVRHLNQNLQILFRRRARDKIGRAELLAKVSHHLSVCPAPPNIDTFNTLIVGFAHLQETNLYNCTTVALSHTCVRPNEVTLASIFKYDAETRNYDHFRLWLGRLRGNDGGLHAARKDIVIDDSNKARLFRRPDSNSGAIVQLPQPTPIVFNALVSGLLSFFGFDTALKVCYDMGQDGWGLSIAGMQPLLEDCAKRGDWASGVAIWERIQVLKAQSRRRFRWGWNTRNLSWVSRSEKIQLPTYMAMLRLCRRCERKDAFKKVINQAAEEHQVELPRLIDSMKSKERRTIKMAFEASGTEQTPFIRASNTRDTAKQSRTTRVSTTRQPKQSPDPVRIVRSYSTPSELADLSPESFWSGPVQLPLRT